MIISLFNLNPVPTDCFLGKLARVLGVVLDPLEPGAYLGGHWAMIT